MPLIGSVGERPFEQYDEALQALHVVAGAVLFEFARDASGNRDTIIRNFIARADMSSRAVFELWGMGDFQDCWVLHRCLLDRLFHLRHLDDTDSFDDFEAWSFLQQYNANHRILSDQDISPEIKQATRKLTDAHRGRAAGLLKNPPKWRRPKAEDVARAMDMRFLYVYSYDYASGHVHPLASDGDQDFHTITGLEPTSPFPNDTTVLGNTLLIATMVVQEGLNASSLKWRALLYNFLDDLRTFMATGTPVYRERLHVIASSVQQGVRLCGSATPE